MDRRPDGLARWVPVLRLVASAVMLSILLSRVRLGALIPTWRPTTAVLLAAALLVTALGIVLSALRWQRVLAALDVAVALPTLVRHYLAGLFVGNFLPSTIGGDVLRVSRLSAATGEAPTTFASVVLERLTGWIVLPVITLTGLVLNPGLRRLGTASTVALAVSISTLLLLAVVLVAAASPRVGGRLIRTEGWVRFIGAVHLGLDRFRRHPLAVVSVVGVGFVYQLAVVLAAFLAAKTLGLDISWTAALAFIPAVAIVQVLPVTVGGLGVREGAFVLFLTPLGVTTHGAIALGLLVYLLNLVVSLLGAPAFALSRERHLTRTA